MLLAATLPFCLLSLFTCGLGLKSRYYFFFHGRLHRYPSKGRDGLCSQSGDSTAVVVN